MAAATATGLACVIGGGRFLSNTTRMEFTLVKLSNPQKKSLVLSNQIKLKLFFSRRGFGSQALGAECE